MGGTEEAAAADNAADDADAQADEETAAAEETEAASDGETADVEPEAAEDTVEETPPVPVEEDEIVDDPIYALAIGFMKDWLYKQGEDGSIIANYLIAKTYLDWLDDELQASAQPVDRTAAREEAEENFARAVERFNYSPQVYANRGLNLAWLDNKELASEQLVLAQKYAPQQPGGVWDTIREAWEIIGDEDKIAIVDELISQMRQDQLEQQIRKATSQAGSSPDNPIKIDLGGGDEAEATEVPAADRGDPPAEDGGEAATE